MEKCRTQKSKRKNNFASGILNSPFQRYDHSWPAQSAMEPVGSRCSKTVSRGWCGATAGSVRPPIASPATPISLLRYEKCDIDNFHDYNDSLSKAVGRARRFVEEFPAVDRGLLLYGRPGLGKTHLAIACLKLAAQARGLRGVFYDTRELLRRIRQSARSGREPPNQSGTSSMPSSGRTCWYSTTLAPSVRRNGSKKCSISSSTRATTARRPTIFTTNYPIEPPSEAKHAETLLERVGFRMYSRLLEMSDFVRLEGEDYREAGPNPSAEQLARLSQRGSRTHKHLPSPGAKSQLKARFRGTEPAPDLKWPGGRAGS